MEKSPHDSPSDTNKRIAELKRLMRETERELKTLTGERPHTSNLADDDALREGAEHFRLVIEDSEQVFLYTHSRDHRFEYLSPSTLAVLGYEPEELVGQPYEQLLIPGDMENDKVPIWTEKAMQQGKPTPLYLASVEHKDGRRIVLEIQEIPILRHGSVVGIHGIARDISQRAMAQEATKKSESRFRAVFEQAAVGMCLVSEKGKFLRTNRRFCEIIGYTAREFLERDCIETTHPDDREMDAERVSRVLAGEFQNQTWEKRYLHKNGTTVWCRISLSLIPGESDRERQFMGVIEDITQRRKRDEQLHMLEKCVSHINDMVVVTEAEPLDEPGPRIVYVNDAFVSRTGYTREEVMGKSPRFLQGPKTQSDALDRIRTALTKCQPVREELINYTKSGKAFWLEIDIVPIADVKGRFTHMIAIERDITQRRQDEKMFRQNQTMLRIAGSMAHLGGWSVDLLDQKITFSDETFIIHDLPLGQTPTFEEAFAFYPPEYREIVAENFRLLSTDGIPYDFESEMITAKGRRIWVRSMAEPERDSSGQIVRINGSIQDISATKEAEKILKQNQTMLRVAGNAARLGGWHIDLPDYKLSWTEEIFVVFDLTPGQTPEFEEAISYFPPVYRDMVLENMSLLATEGTSFDIELEVITAKERRIWVRAIGEAQRDKTGKIIGANGAFQDISKSKTIELMLTQNQKMLRVAGTMALLGGWSIELPDKLFWSDETALIHDAAPGETPNLEDAIAFYKPEYHEMVANHVDLLATKGIPFEFESEMITAKKREIWVRANGSAERDSSGKIIRISGALQDITKSKKADLALIASNRALKLLSSCSEILVRSKNEAELISDICKIAIEVGGFKLAAVGYLQDDDEKTIKIQTSFGKGQEYLADLQVSGCEQDQSGQGPAGKAIRSGKPVIIPDVSKDPTFSPWLKKARDNGISGVYALPLKTDNSTLGVLVLYTSEVRDTPNQDEVDLLSELADDLSYGITHTRSEIERCRMEVAMQKMAVKSSSSASKDLFRKLAANMEEALDADAVILSCVMPEKPGKARTIAVIVDGEEQSNFEYEISESPCRNLLSNEEFIVPKDLAVSFPESPQLQRIDAESYIGRVLTNSNNEPIGCLFALYHRPLKASKFLSSTLQIFASRASAELARRSSDARLQEQASLLDRARDAILVHDMDQSIRYCNHGARELYGWGDDDLIGKSAVELLYPDREKHNAALKATLATGDWQGEIEKINKAGETIIVDDRWTLVTDQKGNAAAILSIATDITERKKLEQQFLRAQRMESIGTLAGGIAHDLNNVLSPIMMSIEMLKADEADPAKLEILDILKTSSQRGADMVRQVLSFARGMEGQKLELQVGDLITEIKNLANDTFLKNIKVQTDVPDDLWTVLGDSSQLHQALLNLCVNARDAMPEGGLLSIVASNQMLDEHYAGMNIEARSGPYLCIQLEDTGTGMPPEVLDRIFDPFFTTKAHGEGTGLGLSTTISIVQGHGGFIRAYSETGVGTRFSVYIPAQMKSDANTTGKSENLKAESLRGEGQLILVVDDEADIRKITKQTLEAFGYRVVLAPNGSEATAIYGDRGEEIAAVFTDMMMPIMDGPATIEALMQMDPEVRVIAASGLNIKGMAAKATNVGAKHFLPKPYTAEMLLKTLHTVLHT